MAQNFDIDALLQRAANQEIEAFSTIKDIYAFDLTSDSALALGTCYLNGWGTACDLVQAAALFRNILANNPHEDTVNTVSDYLSQTYIKGLTSQIDGGQAEQFYQEAFNYGYPQASYNLALMYLQQEENLAASIKALHALSCPRIPDEDKNALAVNLIALSQKEEENLAASIKASTWILQALSCPSIPDEDKNTLAANLIALSQKENASNEIMINVGLLYFYDFGINQHQPQKAYDIFSKAAAAGCSLAHYYLGQIFQGGQGIDADLTRAATEYTLALESKELTSENLQAIIDALKVLNASQEAATILQKHLFMAVNAGKFTLASKLIDGGTALDRCTDAYGNNILHCLAMKHNLDANDLNSHLLLIDKWLERYKDDSENIAMFNNMVYRDNNNKGETALRLAMYHENDRVLTEFCKRLSGANASDDVVLCQIAQAYHYIAQDVETAVFYYVKSAKCNTQCIDGTKRAVEVLQTLYNVNDSENTDVIFGWALCLERGYGVKQDLDAGVALYLKAARVGGENGNNIFHQLTTKNNRFIKKMIIDSYLRLAHFYLSQGEAGLKLYNLLSESVLKPNDAGETPLNIAMQRQDKAVVKFFYYFLRCNKLHYLVYCNEFDAIPAAIANGANPKEKNYLNTSPIRLAAQLKHWDCLLKLLPETGPLSKEERYQLGEILRWAVLYNQRPIITRLLSLNVATNWQPDSKANIQEPLLHLAIKLDHTEIATALLQHLPSNKIDGNALCLDGMTALEIALRYKQIDIVNRLLDYAQAGIIRIKTVNVASQTISDIASQLQEEGKLYKTEEEKTSLSNIIQRINLIYAELSKPKVVRLWDDIKRKTGMVNDDSMKGVIPDSP